MIEKTSNEDKIKSRKARVAQAVEVNTYRIVIPELNPDLESESRKK